MTNPFTKSAKQARDRGEPDTARRLTIEGRVVSKLIKHALKAGYTVSVYDGEEFPLKYATSYAKIIDACFSTDSDVLVFRRNDAAKHDGIGTYVGRVILIYGNEGYDVISDYAGGDDLEGFSAWLKPVEDYAEALGNGRVPA